MSISIYRFISIYITSFSFLIFNLYLSLKVIRRRPKNRLSQQFFGLTISISIALILNMIYASFVDPNYQALVSFLSILTIYFLTFSSGFMLLFMSSLYNPKIFENIKFQLAFLVLYGLILSGMFAIKDGVVISIDNGIQSSPVWNLPFFLFNLIFILISSSLTLYIGYKNYQRFKSKLLRKKIGYLIKGTFLYYTILFSMGLFNFLNITFLRILYVGFASLIFIAALFFYKGIGESVKKSFEEVFNGNDLYSTT